MTPATKARTRTSVVRLRETILRAERVASGSEASTDAVDPAVTTYAWSTDGAACAECGEVVERRWTQDGHLVCGACKSW